MPRASLMELTDEAWQCVIAAHVGLWSELVSNVEKLERASWDVLVVMLDSVYCTTVATPARQKLPFIVPQSPADDRFADHFEVHGDASVRIEVAEFDVLEQQAGELDSTAAWHAYEAVHLRAVQESLAHPDTEATLSRLGRGSEFTIVWTPPSESGTFATFEHLRGPGLGAAEPATSAYAAMVPLLWHAQSFVGRSHSGLVFEGDILVEATLSGACVTDATLARLSPQRAAACESLRKLTFRGTCVTERGLAFARERLPRTEVDRE